MKIQTKLKDFKTKQKYIINLDITEDGINITDESGIQMGYINVSSLLTSDDQIVDKAFFLNYNLDEITHWRKVTKTSVCNRNFITHEVEQD